MTEVDLYKCTEHRSMDLAECEPIHEARYQAVMATEGSAQLDALVTSDWWTAPAGDFPCCAPVAPRPVPAPLAMLRAYVAARPDQWITQVTATGAHYRI